MTLSCGKRLLDEPGTSCDTRKQESAQKYDGDKSQGHRHLERAPTDQIRDNVSTQILRDSNEL